MNYELRITNYETNTQRHAELDSASPAYKAFDEGIAGHARNDGAAETVTNCNQLKLRGKLSHNWGHLKKSIVRKYRTVESTTNCSRLKNEGSKLSHNLGQLKLILAKNETATNCSQLNLHAQNGNFKWGTNCPLLEAFVTQPLKGVKSIAWGNALRVKANNNTSPVRAQSLKIK